jgi:hypothetical protein
MLPAGTKRSNARRSSAATDRATTDVIRFLHARRLQVPFLIAATISPEPDPHREMDLMAWLNGMSTRCTRSRLRI